MTPMPPLPYPSKRYRIRRTSAAVTFLQVLVVCCTNDVPRGFAQDDLTPPSENPAQENQPAMAPPYPAPDFSNPTPEQSGPDPAIPALDLRSSPAEAPKTSLFKRWWFWTAVSSAVAATVAVIVVSSRGHAPPTTDLGNQEFQP